MQVSLNIRILMSWSFKVIIPKVMLLVLLTFMFFFGARQVRAEQFTETTTETAEMTEMETPKKRTVKVTALRTTSTSAASVRLSWEASGNPDKYKIYRKKEDGKYKLIAVTKKMHYHDKTLTAKRKYQYKVVAFVEDETGKYAGIAKTVTLKNDSVVDYDHQKYTYKELIADQKELVKKYSDIARMEQIGTSVQGRKIYDLVIGNPDAEKSILVTAAIHAREYATSALCMEVAEYYLENYYQKIDGKKVSKVLDDCNIHIVPMLNPDGVTIAQNEKPYLKANAKGVDLNRNFPKKDRVTGQPETKAIIRLTRKLKKSGTLKGIVNYHAMGQIVFGGYSGNDKNMKETTKKMYWVARNTTGYADEGGYSASMSTAEGYSYRDYTNHIVKIPSITIEVGRISCPVPYSQYADIFQKNRYVLLRIADLF